MFVRMFVLLVVSLPQVKSVSRSCPYMVPTRRSRTPASMRTSMSAGAADVPISRDNLWDEIGIDDDMLRPW